MISSKEPKKQVLLTNVEDRSFDHVEDPTYQKSKRPHTLTEKGLEYQLSLKEKKFQKNFRKLKDKLHELDMEWIDISDPDVLRKKRSDIEECRHRHHQFLFPLREIGPLRMQTKLR